jgi:hypothetical protein
MGQNRYLSYIIQDFKELRFWQEPFVVVRKKDIF